MVIFTWTMSVKRKQLETIFIFFHGIDSNVKRKEKTTQSKF